MMLWFSYHMIQKENNLKYICLWERETSNKNFRSSGQLEVFHHLIPASAAALNVVPFISVNDGQMTLSLTGGL